MKKVININFQGRVIPIEETAYELLKQYVDSLRRYFENEEGREEIINDIENRIAELFSERLKNGATCITDDDVNRVINDMGRPEDFDEHESVPPAAAQTASGYQQARPGARGSLYRNTDDKVLAGVCSGLANYLGIDPVFIRILFVALFGLVFWLYILMWIIVPAKSIESNITKRLFRNPDQKAIAGVCGGIAAYFNTEVWIPRLVFALPFILGLMSTSFHALWWNWDFGWMPRILSGSFGWTMFLTYVVLWIAVPYANTASEKLEMRGEKVDLNSIRNTVKEEMGNFRGKAERFGADLKVSARQFGEQASAQAKVMAADVTPAVRRTASGLGHAIGVLFRAFFIFIFAIVAIALFGAFIALLFGGVALAPLKGFILEGPVQSILAWLTLFLFFMIPLVAFVTWGIRRLVGAKSKRHFVGVSFLGLWIIGLICGITLLIMIAKNFKSGVSLKEEQVATVTLPRLYVDVQGPQWKDYDHRFFGMDIEGNGLPFYDINEDSIFINTVRVSMAKSSDSAFHVYRIRSSRGSDRQKATRRAKEISFNVERYDSTLLMPRGFSLGRDSKFRNQRVWMVIEVPAGKKITFSNRISDYNWFTVRSGPETFEVLDDDFDDRDQLSRAQAGRTYIMNSDGRAERVDD